MRNLQKQKGRGGGGGGVDEEIKSTGWQLLFKAMADRWREDDNVGL